MTISELTFKERQVLQALGHAWNLYLELPTNHRTNSDDLTDFRRAIHEGQRIVMSRPAQRFLEDREGFAAAE